MNLLEHACRPCRQARRGRGFDRLQTNIRRVKSHQCLGKRGRRGNRNPAVNWKNPRSGFGLSRAGPLPHAATRRTRGVASVYASTNGLAGPAGSFFLSTSARSAYSCARHSASRYRPSRRRLCRPAKASACKSPPRERPAAALTRLISAIHHQTPACRRDGESLFASQCDPCGWRKSVDRATDHRKAGANWETSAR